MRIVFVVLLLISNVWVSSAQTDTDPRRLPDSEEVLDSVYKQNIRLSKINGVYIPKDLNDAFVQLERLTPAESLLKFKSAPEEEVCRKLHFGIGRWMILNWNFYQGSRLSHYLKSKGLSHPDDMAQFILRTFHRHLLSKDLEQEALIKELIKAREEEVEYLINN